MKDLQKLLTQSEEDIRKFSSLPEGIPMNLKPLWEKLVEAQQMYESLERKVNSSYLATMVAIEDLFNRVTTLEEETEEMICEPCTRCDHAFCKNGTWCDCAHKPPAIILSPPGIVSEEVVLEGG